MLSMVGFITLNHSCLEELGQAPRDKACSEDARVLWLSKGEFQVCLMLANWYLWKFYCSLQSGGREQKL